MAQQQSGGHLREIKLVLLRSYPDKLEGSPLACHGPDVSEGKASLALVAGSLKTCRFGLAKAITAIPCRCVGLG